MFIILKFVEVMLPGLIVMVVIRLPVRWDKTVIVVMNEVRVSSPYLPESVSGGTPAANDRVKKVVRHLKDDTICLSWFCTREIWNKNAQKQYYILLTYSILLLLFCFVIPAWVGEEEVANSWWWWSVTVWFNICRDCPIGKDFSLEG